LSELGELAVKAEKIRKDDFYLPLLRLIERLGGSASIEELEDPLIQEFEFSEDDIAATHLKSGALIIPNKIAWARSYLKLAGLLDSERRGVWVLTDVGRTALAGGEKVVRSSVIDAVRAYKARRKAALSAEQARELLDDTDAEVPETLGGNWSERLLTKMQSIEPAAFERLCQRLLREHGFTRVQVTGKSGDGGIDGQGVLRVNLVSFHVYFQCKRYKGSVSTSMIRDFRGAMQGRADKGLVITTGTFTPDARKEATRDGAPAIDLIDGEALCELLRNVELGVRVRQVVSYEIEVDEGFFDEI
jgi:restriction system protein